MREDATVLVLDDDQDFAETLKSILEAKGYPAIVALEGRSGLRTIKSQSVAVAVIDLKLDDMPGIEVMRKIKQRAPSTECILLTGYASQEIAIEAINLGGFGFLKKPCDLDQLLVMVRRAVEKRDATEALRESERHTRAILHSSLDAVVTLDDLGVVIDWNPQAEKTLGYLRRETLGRHFFDLIFRDQDEAMRKAWGAPAEVGLLGRAVEARLRHKDGHEIMAEWAVTSVEVAERRTFTFFIKDITRRKRLEEQFLRAQRLEAVGLLAGGVLHDFNNVLTAIMGQSALLRQDAKLAPEHRLTSQEILDAAQRASGLAQKLLAYGRPQVRDPQQIDINGVVVGLSRLLKRMLGESIDLRRRLAEPLPAILIDRSELEQVIVNLIRNSREAMPEGGVISLETRLAKTAEPAAREGLELVVRDYGVGMGKTTLIRALEPFFTTKALGQGAGLGLSTAKNIVDEAGGHITLESEPGKGTTCRIFFPTAPPPENVDSKAPGDSASSSPPSEGGEVAGTEVTVTGGTETILVVEDEDIVRKTLLRILRKFGYQVIEASGGEEALKILRSPEVAIDLLITDLVMPVMSGRELVRRMREECRETRILFISGYSEHADARGLSEGGAELLPKPFAPEALLVRVRKILDSSSQE